MLPIWRNRPLVVTIIVVIILVVLLIVTAGDNNMSGAESVVGSILSPVQNALYSATDAIADFFSRIFSGADIEAENAALQERVAELEAQLMDYDEMKLESERLKEFLNFNTETEGLEYVTAKVIGKGTGHWFNMFIINVGLKDGIAVDMPIVNGDGLIGRVVATGYNYSRVLTIVDSSSGVSAIVERTRDNGILNGTVSTGDEEDALLTMSYLPLDADLVPGDTVITSGLAGVFPKGIAIGEVIEVSKSDDGMKNEAVISPYVDFYHLEEVMVITSATIDIEEALE
ncbi:MAG: rod shape-determining protein MreC [Eubacteriales bacterium]|nr:rod shape-determining protein MreC [Eubacteriales bacterium]